MKLHYFDCHKDNQSIWQLNWLGKKKYFKIFISYGLNTNHYYTINQIFDISELINDKDLLKSIFEPENTNLQSMDCDTLHKILGYLPASNSAKF